MSKLSKTGSQTLNEFASSLQDLEIAKLDGRRIKKTPRTHCKKGHALTGDNVYVSNGYPTCRQCSLEQAKGWRNTNRERYRELSRSASRAKNAVGLNKDKYRAYRLSRYGLTEQTFTAMMEAQGNACAICGMAIDTRAEFSQIGPGGRILNAKRTACIDHCHATGKVRGVLCMLCNRGLGDFSDSPERMRAAADYIERNRK